MSSFKKNFRDSIVAPYIKYNQTQKNVGEVLQADKKRKTCTISYTNISGISIVEKNVPYKKGLLRGFLGGFPKEGDYVELEEDNKLIRIINVIDKEDITESNTTEDTQSSGSSYSGYLGV